MKLVLFQIKDAIKNVLKILFASDLEVMSDEVRQILSDPEDAKKYKEAVRLIQNGEEEKTIELSNHKKLTLIK